MSQPPVNGMVYIDFQNIISKSNLCAKILINA